MYLGRVTGRLVASTKYEGLEGVPLQLLQPIDEDGEPMGDAIVATAVVPSGPGDFVHWIDGREAALTCPKTFVPVDASIIGIVEQAVSCGRIIGREEA